MAKNLIINNLETTLIRQKRLKTIRLQVEANSICIKAPFSVSEKYIKRFVEEHWAWVEKRLQERSQAFNFKHKDKFLFLGQERELIIHQGTSFHLLEKQTFRVHHPTPCKEAIRRVLQRYFQKEAALLFPSLVNKLATKTTLTPSQLKIRSFKARWGSCSASAEISLNWKLLIAPIETIEYVIIHELCHLQEFNHSKSFWRLVESHCPNIKKHKDWLNKNAHFLRVL